LIFQEKKKLKNKPRKKSVSNCFFFESQFSFQKKAIWNKKHEKKIFMKNFTTYLSTAPVVALVWFTFTAALLIEINRFFPDPLVFSF
jgi:photosystem I subunit 9